MNDDATLHDAKLQEVARRLGAGAAERLDVERTAQAVVARLRTEPRAEIRVLGWIRPAWLRIAALFVIVVGAGVVALNVRIPRLIPPVPPATAGGELSDLSGDELREILESVGKLGGGGEQQAVSAQDVGLDELSASQLRALLESLGG